MRRQQPGRECTCAGTAPGYPQHEQGCGQPEPDDIGCCSACSGTGSCGWELCTDCFGTGHCHAMDGIPCGGIE